MTARPGCHYWETCASGRCHRSARPANQHNLLDVSCLPIFSAQTARGKRWVLPVRQEVGFSWPEPLPDLRPEAEAIV